MEQNGARGEGQSRLGAAALSLARGRRQTLGSTDYTADDLVSLASCRPVPQKGLNPASRCLLKVLSGGDRHRIDELAAALVDRFGIDSGRAAADVASFVAEGQQVGLISLHSSVTATARQSYFVPAVAMVIDPFGEGLKRPSVRRRWFAPGWIGVAGLTARAQAVLGVLIALPLTLFVVPLLLGTTPWEADPQQGALLLTFGSSVVVGMVVLGVVHELAHLAIARLLGASVLGMYSQGLRVGLCRTPSTPWRDAVISLAGPVLAVVLGVGVGLWLAISLDPTTSEFMVRPALFALVIVTIYHSSCLFPPAVDGRALTAALRRRREPRSQEGTI